MPQNHLQLVDQGLPELGHLSVPLVLLQLLLQLGERLCGLLQPCSSFLELARVAFLQVGQTPSPFLLPRLKRKQDKKTVAIYPILPKHQPVGALCSSQQRHRSDSSDEPLDGNYGEADIKVDWSKWNIMMFGDEDNNDNDGEEHYDDG